jgi:beta-glucosidase/6-phospho-beta-glucosidase/beta-galactosidase
MATKRFTFPDNFQWGTATAAHQVEGNNVNSDFWLLEHTPGSPYVEPSGDACDQYRRMGRQKNCRAVRAILRARG